MGLSLKNSNSVQPSDLAINLFRLFNFCNIKVKTNILITKVCWDFLLTFIRKIKYIQIRQFRSHVSGFFA